MRRLYLLLIAVVIIVFLAVSALLARVFSVEAAERSAITTLVQDEARGEGEAMLSVLRRCTVACQARVAADAASLRHPGPTTIIQMQASAGFSLSSTLGTARVVFAVGGSLPIVQCVRVRRAGNALTGLNVELLDLSRRIKSDSACPARF
ncbi:MAG: hypothetical protein ACYC91_10270 [Solirubrobacteraceae bacterium]